ncbi:MAG: DUF4140 domain-containing protein, partial [Deltaproteobacteria bacterium]|nr:DUF4140 domain-containing protein [Deltaproteobacteria bacterium]
MSSATRTPIEAPITTVTVLEDRAQIERSLHVTAVPGRNRLDVPNVTPVLSDKTLKVRLWDAPAGARAVGSRVRRHARVLDAQRPEGVADLEGRIRETEEQHRQLSEDVLRLEGELALLTEAEDQFVTDIMTDAGWG